MWFLIVFLLDISPRLVLVVIGVTSRYLHVFDSGLCLLLGFIFMPWTTLWCAYVYNNGGFDDWRGIVLAVCIVTDLVRWFKKKKSKKKTATSDPTGVPAR